MNDTAEFEVIEQEDIQSDLRAVFRGAVKLALEEMLEEVVRELVGGSRWARLGHARKDVRNGTYLRQLITSLGHIEINVPRTRHSGSAADVLGRYQRRTEDVDEAITAAYVHGVSTRKMSEVTKALMGAGVREVRSQGLRATEVRSQGLRATPRDPDPGSCRSDDQGIRTLGLVEAMTSGDL